MPDAAPQQPTDDDLLARVADGDPTAVRLLMDRFDRLVRYTIFRQSRERCRRDPLWLDSVASEVWSDVCRSLGKSPGQRITHVHSYFIQISRRRCIDALRLRGNMPFDAPEAEDLAQATVNAEDTSNLLSRIEELAALRERIAGLPEADRALFGELESITGGRWREAAGRLGVAESTLRSRWKKVLEKLRSGWIEP